jgi:Ca2+:H+ antiporter
MVMRWFLLFTPLAFSLKAFSVDPSIVFLASTMAIIPLAKLMEEATSVLAKSMGPTYGGLLNATMGNAPELIIGLFALQNGLIDMLKASIAGSIIGTLLFGVGATMIAGGLKQRVATFDNSMIAMNLALLSVTAFGLLVPAVFNFSTVIDQEISVHISILMLFIYLASIVYTLQDKSLPLTTGSVEQALNQQHKHPIEPMEAPPHWSNRTALILLMGVTVAISFMSDLLTSSIQPAADAMHLTPSFAGVFLLSMVGNIPQYINSVSFASKQQLTLALSVNLSSTTQLALLVAPVLVLMGQAMGLDMNLRFNQFELMGILLAVLISRHLLGDQRSTWLEGFMLIMVYFMLGIGFYYLP